MTDWKHYNSSKYAAKCCYCGRDIHTSEGRWNAVKDEITGKGRWNACHNCIAPPDVGKDASPPAKPTSMPETPPVKPFSSSTSATTVESPSVEPSNNACVSTSYAMPTHTYDHTTRIQKAHDDNMLSQELTRNCIALLITSLNNVCNAINERTRILEEQVKKGG